jgi:rhodanese-related sulfurtransferase
VARARYLGTEAGEDTEQVDREEPLRRAEAGEVVVLDVRPTPEFAAGHIPGAVSIPIDELPERLSAGQKPKPDAFTRSWSSVKSSVG